ncbi:MAG: asparaginase [Cytophagaceae bacterium]
MPSNKSTVLVIYTGGTFGMIYDKGQGTLVPFNIESILDYMPELQRLNSNVEFTTFEKPLDSSNMIPGHWLRMVKIIQANYNKYDGFVILHGTDTMAYSASALSFLLENLDKPVIFTGAQLPVSEVRSDARENFITAIEIAGAKENGRSIIQEVCIYFDYYLLRGNRSRKVQSNHFDAFMSENYPYLAQAGISIEYNKTAHLKPGNENIRFYDRLDERINVVKLFPGISERVLEQALIIDGIKGIILETFGAGNAPAFDWLAGVIRKTVDSGVVVFNVSQCVGGRVNQEQYQTGRILKNAGVISGGSVTSEAAVAKLMFVLGNEPYKSDPGKWLQTPLRGEMEL